MTPISFPYRDMGMIWESHPLDNAKKQEFIHNYFVSILTHNFSVCRPVVVWLTVKKTLWDVVSLQADENCESKHLSERLKVKNIVGCGFISGR